MSPRDPLDIRLGFACTQRWEDMAGDDRVRDCRACARQVFNLSAMTRAEVEALLASRGVMPCVRFYRRPDGTVMTSDCPSGAPKRRLAVLASSVAATATLAAAPAFAETPDDSADVTAGSAAGSDTGSGSGDSLALDPSYELGGPIERAEVGVIVVTETRPAVEWSLWGRLGVGLVSQPTDIAARRVIPAPTSESHSTGEAALGADVTFGIARNDDLRVGAWGELRTTTDPVGGAELVLEGLPPHPYSSRIGGQGSLVLRAGGNARMITGALGFGYVGSWPSWDPWVGWARHVVGARVILSVNRAIDDPRAWSATVGPRSSRSARSTPASTRCSTTCCRSYRAIRKHTFDSSQISVKPTAGSYSVLHVYAVFSPVSGIE